MEEQGRHYACTLCPGPHVATPGALGALEEAAQTPGEFLARHALGDWGELDENDRQENEFSLARGFRLLSAYNLSNGTRIWVITEADCSATTLLLPSILTAPKQATPQRCLFFLLHSRLRAPPDLRKT